jgi:hypothetical protein
MITLKDVVDHYVKCYKPHHDEELRRYRDFLNTSKQADVIIAEVLLIGAHQTRLHDMPSWHSDAKHTIDVLAKAKPWKKNYGSFEEIYEDVKQLIGGIDHIGPLAIYDVALRLAARFNNPSMMPKKVYLSAGPLRAAKVMYKNALLKTIGTTVIKNAFPPEFQKLTCEDIEDLLCVMGHYDVFSNYDNLDKVPCPAQKTNICIMPSRLLGSNCLDFRE